MTLGAIPRQILTMVLREASSLSAAAIAVGMGAWFLVSRFVKSMLFGIAPSDPATLWGAAVLNRRFGRDLDSGAACGERAADGGAPTGLTTRRVLLRWGLVPASEIDGGVIYCDTPTHIDVETFARQPGGAARKALIAEAAERHAARGA